MTDEPLTHHPSPRRGQVGGMELAFALAGGPLAWFAQLNVNYALTAQPCFPGPHRNVELPGDAHWAFAAAIVVYLLLLAVAVAAGLLSLRLFKRTRNETVGSNADVEEAGTGRTRFLAYWGMLMGFGFAVVILVNAVALIMVPQCAM